jgi:hypothetical protein
MPSRAQSRTSARAARHGFVLPTVVCLACASRQVPDPRATVRLWSEALERGDSNTVYALLDESSQQALGREGVTQVLTRDRQELLLAARAAGADNARLETVARVSFEDDRSALLVLEDGQFKLAAAAALPARADTPEDALRELRDVLERRSFAGLLRVLTEDASQTLSGHLEGVVEALGDPGTVQIEVDGRRATARLPGGHTVTMEREDGAWRIRDFD